MAFTYPPTYNPSYLPQRDGIYNEHILEHFLSKSKQTPKPLAYLECQDVVCFKKNQNSMSNEIG